MNRTDNMISAGQEFPLASMDIGAAIASRCLLCLSLPTPPYTGQPAIHLEKQHPSECYVNYIAI